MHTFASDPTRGIFILLILTVFIGGALALFAIRAPELKQGGLFAPISREGALVFNNLFLVAAVSTVFVGTLYPLALEAVTGDKISVGAPFYNLTFVPLMIPLLLALPFGPLLGWKRGDLFGTSQRLGAAMLAALVGAGVTAIISGGTSALAPFGLALGIWVVAGALVDLAERTMLFRVALRTSFSRLFGLPRSAIGTVIAHSGMGIIVVGIVSASAYQSEKIAAMKPGDTMTIGGTTLLYQGSAPATGPNYREERSLFVASRGGKSFPMTPSKRFFATRQTTTTEAAIKTTWFSQLYLSLGDRTDGGAQAVRASFKPLVTLIWLGALVMAFGGALSLSDRRLRVGAPRRASARAAEAAA